MKISSTETHQIVETEAAILPYFITWCTEIADMIASCRICFKQKKSYFSQTDKFLSITVP